jgi:hypothetical protein
VERFDGRISVGDERVLLSHAAKVVVLAFSESLGWSSAVAVETGGFRVQSAKAAAAEASGASAHVVRARIEGWGAAFEARTFSEQIVVDLRQGHDELVQSALVQAATLLQAQMRQRARAAVQGIQRPLCGEEFSDPSRLSLDVACARVLHAAIGSDAAVVSWLRSELAKAATSRMVSANASHVRVHGLRLAVPVLLCPTDMTRVCRPRAGRPLWLDDQVSVLSTDAASVDRLRNVNEDALRDTPLRGRTLQEDEPWPGNAVVDFVARGKFDLSANESEARRPEPIIRERRFRLERHLIGVAEAFC